MQFTKIFHYSEARSFASASCRYVHKETKPAKVQPFSKKIVLPTSLCYQATPQPYVHMTTQEPKAKYKDWSKPWSRIVYFGLVILGLYFLVFNGDYGSAFSNWGIALAFDPFDQKIPWRERPRYQRVWLLAHAGLLLILVGVWLIPKYLG